MDCKFLHVLCFDLKIKAKNSNNPPREKISRTDITMATLLLKQEFLFQSAHDLYFIRLLSPTKCLYRDKKTKFDFDTTLRLYNDGAGRKYIRDFAQYGIYFLPTSRHYKAVMSSQNRI